MKYTILHNPRCSKSRETLNLLEQNGVEPEVIEYLQGGLSKNFLEEVLKKLKFPAKDIIRTKEKEFQELKINLENPQEVISAILNNPKLLERPIVLKGDQAVIGRPPENVLKLL